jgi:transcriptional regulator with XRE-family HTH domain
MTVETKVGAKVRTLRESRGLTLEQLADQCECHASLLEKIEAGDLLPSLTPLMNIARALGIRLGTLLDDEPQNGPVVVRGDHLPRVIRFSGKDPEATSSNLDFHTLAGGKQDRHMEPFVIDVQPRAGAMPPLSSHEGEEFIYVLTGDIEINYGQMTYTLAAGDSVYYDSIVPHDVHAKGGAARILAVVYAPY